MRICAKCGIAKTNYVKKKIKLNNGKIVVLCQPCYEAWSKLFAKNSPRCVTEPHWTNLWNLFIKEKVWSVS